MNIAQIVPRRSVTIGKAVPWSFGVHLLHAGGKLPQVSLFPFTATTRNIASSFQPCRKLLRRFSFSSTSVLPTAWPPHAALFSRGNSPHTSVAPSTFGMRPSGYAHQEFHLASNRITHSTSTHQRALSDRQMASFPIQPQAPNDIRTDLAPSAKFETLTQLRSFLPCPILAGRFYRFAGVLGDSSATARMT